MRYRLIKSLVVIIGALVSSTLLSSCSFAYRHFPYRTVRDLATVENRLRTMISASPNLSMRSIGIVKYGAFTAPIWLVSYRPDGEAKYAVFISGGIHGDEPEGTEAVIQDIEDMSRDHTCYPDTAVDFVPLVNPWGWTRDQRYDRDGADINRTDERIVPQEAAILKAFWKGKHYDLMIDHHEDSRYGGAYLMTYDNRDLSSPGQAVLALSKAGYRVRSDHGYNGVINLTKDEMAVTKITTLMRYARPRYSDRVYILETPYYADETDSLKMSGIVDHALIGRLASRETLSALHGGCSQAF